MKLFRAHKIQNSVSSRVCGMTYVGRKEIERKTVAEARNSNKQELQAWDGKTHVTAKHRHCSQQWSLQRSCGCGTQIHFLTGGRGTHLLYLMWEEKGS